MEPEYRLIAGHPAYRAGNDGSVWSRNNRWGLLPEWKRLHPIIVKSKGRKDYKREMVTLTSGIRRYVHHLVLETFVGPRGEGQEACHKNGTPTDNRADNLYWGTREENCMDLRLHGRKKGERHHNAKLTADIVREIRRRVASGETQQSIADDLGIQRRNVGRIADGTRWSHVV